jgi:hypothetical protein
MRISNQQNKRHQKLFLFSKGAVKKYSSDRNGFFHGTKSWRIIYDSRLYVVPPLEKVGISRFKMGFIPFHRGHVFDTQYILLDLLLNRQQLLQK